MVELITPADKARSGMATVAAIMVNWNGGELALQSARSVSEQTCRPQLWLVDNDSRDGSADAIQAACPETRVIRNSSNQGFASANNQALRAAGSADYVLLINNDAVLPERDALEHMVGRMEVDQSIQGACGRYEYPDGTFQGYYNQLPTPFDMIVQWGFGRHFAGLRNSTSVRRYVLHGHDFSRPATIEQPAFACVLMRGAAMRAVGLFDEQFPLYFNDVDYCWRWRQKGWTWHYFPEWRIVHHQGRSTDRIGSAAQVDLRGSAVRFARKHFSAPAAFLVQSSIVLEAAWRKYYHRDFSGRLRDLWRGRLEFCLPSGQT
jgi:GT2 family glycosyltransferase